MPRPLHAPDEIVLLDSCSSVHHTHIKSLAESSIIVASLPIFRRIICLPSSTNTTYKPSPCLPRPPPRRSLATPATRT
ncbi:hypothetical protein CEP54_004673 [Fusarium duplospermum]|uniref:Uncharacterized protein n=1 Tax=Fusarium duplospermum TaxID=1325734 RepID=A0A428QH05_9HYPO|nr:hypothetical protein CEP54_004673 [Fusarium duplospermum]